MIRNTSKNSKKAPGATITLGSATSDNPVFRVSKQCSSTLAPTKSYKVGVTFAPTSTTTETGHLIVPNNSDTGTLMIPLTGTGKAPKVKKK